MPLYNRTYSIQSQLGVNPSVDQAHSLAMWIREQNGEPCVIDATGCTLSADFITAVCMDENWIRPTTQRTTRWPSHVTWKGVTQANRRTLEQVVKDFGIRGGN